MSGEDRAQPVEVNIGACECPGTPHPDGDLVYLRPTIDLSMGLAAWSAVRQSGRLIGDTDGALLSTFIRYGIVGWTLRDADGPIRVTDVAIQDRLSWGPAALAVAAKAQELYRVPFYRAWMPEQSGSSPESSTTESTSPNPESGPSSPTASVPSLPSEPVTMT